MLASIFHEKVSYGSNLLTQWLCRELVSSRRNWWRSWSTLSDCNIRITNISTSYERMAQQGRIAKTLRWYFKLLQKRSWCTRQRRLGYLQNPSIWKSWIVYILWAHQIMGRISRNGCVIRSILLRSQTSLSSHQYCKWCAQWCGSDEVRSWGLVPRL